MAQKQPTPPVHGGVGNTTCLAACVFPKDTLIPLRAQLLVERFAVPSALAGLLAHPVWGIMSDNANAAIAAPVETFNEHRTAAMLVLTSGVDLRPEEEQFLGGISLNANPLTEKQAVRLDCSREDHRFRVGIQDRFCGGGTGGAWPGRTIACRRAAELAALTSLPIEETL